jgi:deoxyribonuclease-4
VIGAHVSIAGGVENGPHNGARLGCEAIQIFTRSQRQWRPPAFSKRSAQAFREGMDGRGLGAAIAHASYLFNMAGDGLTLSLSREGLLDEWDRSEALGLSGIVLHPGAHCGAGEPAGMERIIDSLNRVERRRPRHRALILLETTAGQGSCLGHRFEQIHSILDGLKRPERFGVCLDTAHVFAAGYDIRTQAGMRRVLREFDRLVGLERLRAFHLNDSKAPLGSRVDRHQHIGQGLIGLEPFRLLVNDRRFSALPMVLETPGGEKHDPMNLACLRGLRIGSPRLPRAREAERGPSGAAARTV